jgi:hypothetical protein
MCAVSAITDYYRDKWPVVPMMPPNQFVIEPMPVAPPIHHPAFILKPGITITQEQWAEYQELKRRMEAYDAESNQPDCIKPEVAVWEEVVKQFVNN